MVKFKDSFTCPAKKNYVDMIKPTPDTPVLEIDVSS